MKNLLYIGWIGFNNLGDELLWNIFKEKCGEYLDENDFKITPSVPGVNLNNLEEYDMVILGGGSLLLPGYLQILKNALHHGKSVAIWGSGIDWIERKYLDLLESNQLKSMEQNFKQKDVAILEEVIEKATFVGVRGPLTKKAIEIMIGTEKAKKVKIIGDPGLLLKEPILTNKKEKIIGINWGTTYNRLYGGDEAKVEDQLVKAVKELIKSGNKIYIYTVWGNDIAHCERLYKKINDTQNVMLDKNLYNEKELMEKLSHFKATINFKLHASYLSLTANVPAIALGYRFKVFDNATSLGLQHLVVSTDSQELTKDILDRVENIEKNEIEIIEQYKATKKKYKSLLDSMFTNNYL